MVAELLEDRSGVVGAQWPRVLWTPDVEPSELDWALADECLSWARDVLRVELDPWERFVLRWMLVTRAGRWACFEFGLLVSRQNGKSLLFVIRALFALFVLKQNRVVYSTHRGDTAREQFQMAMGLIEDADGLSPWKPYESAGRETLDNCGRVLKFKTRSKSGGRGLGGDTLILDEAQELDDDQFQSISPILAARTMTGNPQLVYGGSAGNRRSSVWARVRRRGLAGGDARLGYMEWSIDGDVFLLADPASQLALAGDVASMAQANPALGIVRDDGTGGISAEYLDGQRRAMDPIGFAREHLGVGDWPMDDTTDWAIPRIAWHDCADTSRPPPVGRLVLALDVTPDRAWSSIAVVGESDDKIPYGGLIEPGGRQPGTGWVVARVVELKSKHRPLAVVLDPHGPAGALVAPLEAAGVELEKVTTIEAAHACAGLYDAAVTSRLRHRGQPAMDAALAGAKRRQLGDGWAWDRRGSNGDLSPLIALTLAHWGFQRFAASSLPPEIF